MNIIPKILISWTAPNDPNDENEYTNIVYQRIEDAIVQGFNAQSNYVSFDASNIKKYYFGLEDAFKYAYLNDYKIICYPHLAFSQDALDISRKYYRSVHLIHSACGVDHIHSNILDIPQHIIYVGSGGNDRTKNVNAYNIDFWVNADAPLPNEPQTATGYFAGVMAYMLYKTGINYWQCRDLLMRTCFGANVNILHEPSEYYVHYTEENGYGRPDTSTAVYLYDNDHHIFQQDPFLLYKLRSIDMTEQTLLITSVLMPADIEKNLFIGLDGALCGSDAKALGVLNADTVENEYGPVATSGIVLVTSGGAIAQGAKVASNAAGKAVTFSSGELNGYALDSSTGADQKIRVKLI